ncbi:amphi-Trp domain-containing protein [Maridesulfovibrio zosterae]|uniref:amphi-Trp domain-containing protein n=1 Tax=Maridesulfovibrio zosterae TaxID=82171 RepID=UPI00041D610B|nr:amphi-Trp domain-containing protein [Maridesulfovibrio zosterae]
MSIDQKFVFESLQDSETIRQFLKSLVDGFDTGKISLSTNGDEIELTPKGLLNFSVKAKKKETDNKISIKISWKESKANASPVAKTINVNS